MITLGELAESLGLTFNGEPRRELKGLASLDIAGAGDVSFLSDRSFVASLEKTRAAAVVLHPDYASYCPVDYILSDDPYLSYAQLSKFFDTSVLPAPGIDRSANMASDVKIGEGVSIGPNVCIGSGTVVKDRVVIEAGVFLGADVEIGESTRLFPNVVIYHGVRLGSFCRIHANSTIGADGFGFARNPHGWERIAQLGGVLIGDRVDIGANTTVDRGALGDTVLASGVILDDQVHIGHNCEIGENTAIAGCVGIAGSTKIGANCTLAGQVGVVGHISICDDVHITGQGRVLRSISKAGTYSSGTHLSNHRTWVRLGARFDQLEELNRRITALEKTFKNQMNQEVGEV